MVINVFSFNRFDSTNRYINDPNVRLEFYASDEVKVDKKIVSRPTCIFNTVYAAIKKALYVPILVSSIAIKTSGNTFIHCMS